MSLVSSSVTRQNHEPCVKMTLFGRVEITSCWYYCARASDSRLTELGYESCVVVTNHW